MAKSKATVNCPLWTQSRRDASLTAIVAIVAAYILAARAIDTGSLGQYFVVLVLIILFFNRLRMAVRAGK